MKLDDSASKLGFTEPTPDVSGRREAQLDPG